MIRKITSVFAAASVSMCTTAAVPVAVTTVASVTFVSGAQAFGLKSIKKAVKKVAKKTSEGVKDLPDTYRDAYVAMGKGAGKRIKRGAKRFIRDTKGAGRIASGAAKSAVRTFDRRTSQACLALGSCRGTITGGAVSSSRGVVRKSRSVRRSSRGITRRSHGMVGRSRRVTRR